MMPLTRQPSARWAWSLSLAATLFVAACDARSTFPSAERDWGFITVATQRAVNGTYRTVPSALFFRGSINAVPNASVLLDSCVADVPYSPNPEITGVVYLDAGAAISAKIGNITESIPRVSSGGRTTYEKPATPTTFTPGDSIVVTIPGAAAGFPSAEIRGKTAEPFTLINAIVPQTGTTALQLRWTPGQDASNAMIVALRYAPAGSVGISRVITCSFQDDGVDSIPFRQHQKWSVNSNSAREAVVTRLRTAIKSTSTGGVLEIISTFQIPTPVAP